MEWCEACNRSFVSQEALDQHLRDSPAHAVIYDCEPCNRSFGSQEALDQHLRDSPAHAVIYDCEPCNRSFSSQEALDQHLRDSPAHAVIYDCEPCNRSFGSQEALDQHLRDSPAHAVIYDCEPCNRSFGSQEALDQHLRDSPAHAQLSRTPLDIFFLSFNGFLYDPTLAPTESYSSLQRYYGWRRGERESDQAWQQFQEALSQEFKLWFGTEDDLVAWHSLCRAVKIEPLPSTCLDCEKVELTATSLRHNNVNFDQ
jgi:heat shock protein HslJ